MSVQVDTAPAVHDLIKNRWSPRAFDPRPVSRETLEAIFEAARWASSSYNEQPWRFVIATRDDAEAYSRILDLLAAPNQVWAKSAPVLMITAGKKTFSHNGKPNGYGLHDAGQALAHLLLQASALGLHGHAMGGFDRVKAREVLGIPDDYEVGAALALGYAPESVTQSPRERKALGEIVFEGKWNNPF